MRRSPLFVVYFAVITFGLSAQSLPSLAVVEFTKNIINDKIIADAITVRNLVESQMLSTQKYQIIIMDDIDKILKNQSISLENISSTENIKKLQQANVSYIVSGSVNAMDDDYAITVRMLDVAKGQFIHSSNDFMRSSSRELYTGINTLMAMFITGIPPIASGNYRVGDIGPAGGYIFYDKGRVSDGWRYLEAAPYETEFLARASSKLIIRDTAVVLSSGKKNTEIIVDSLRQNGISGSVAQLCANLRYNGFSDWFLPSKDELDLKYRNLKQRGLGDFGNGDYWSSSIFPNTGWVWYQEFKNGSQAMIIGINNFSARAIRAF